jgi:outer membrane protein TolC
VQVAFEQARAALLPTVGVNGRYTYNYPSAEFDLNGFSAATVGLTDTLIATSTPGSAQATALQTYRDMLTANTGGGRVTIVKTNQLDFTATANVPLLVPGAYPVYQAAKLAKQAAAANLAVTETQLLLGAANAFYGAAGADELVSARKNAIAVAQQTVKNAQARLAAGVVNRVEVSRAELAYVRVVQQLAEAEDVRAQAYRSLATLLQLREAFVVRPAERASPATALADLQRGALTLRPELRAYELNVEVQRKQRLSGTLRWLPSISAFARFGAGNYVGFSGQAYSFAAGAQADWVLYDGGVRGAARKQAASQVRALGLQLAQLRDTINDDIAQAERVLKTKREALETALRSVRLSKETLELVRAQHDAGTATQLDLLQAQDALVNAEVGVAQARFDLAMGQLQLERLAGTFPQPVASR